MKLKNQTLNQFFLANQIFQTFIQIIIIIQNYSKNQMQDNAKIKSQDRTQKLVQYKCQICSKMFPKQSDLDAHIKLKHQKQEKQKQKQRSKEKEKQPPKQKQNKVQPRNRVLQMQQNEHEDIIYSYLGQLGQKNQENSSRQDLLLADENQRQSIQTNYSFNKVVRTPYQKQITPITIIPNEWIETTPHVQFMKTLVAQMTALHLALDAQKQKWQFRDPMAPEEEAEDQFSLMEIRKLILNYPRRKLQLKYPHFSIFLLWVGRICKPQAWEQFFIVIGSYLAEFYSRRNMSLVPSQRWEQFNVQFNGENLKPYITQKLTICDDKTVKKLTQFFNKWVNLFDLVNQFC